MIREFFEGFVYGLGMTFGMAVAASIVFGVLGYAALYAFNKGLLPI